MTNSEKILTLKRLFVTTRKLSETIEPLLPQGKATEQDIDKVIDYIDEMIALLPVSFPIGVKPEPAIIINLNNPEDEPTSTTPMSNLVLYEAELPVLFEGMKFYHWNYVTVVASEKSKKDKYKPLMIAQAKKCLALFTDYKNLQPNSAEMDLAMLCTQQIGHYALTDENDPVELEKTLNYLEPGFAVTTWLYYPDTKEVKVRLLQKLGKVDDVYDLIFDGFKDMDMPYGNEKLLESIAQGQYIAIVSFINDNNLYKKKKRAYNAKGKFLLFELYSEDLTAQGQAFVKLAAEPWFRSRASAKDPGNIELLEKYLKQVRAGK